jgi:hypothetical protein
MTPRRLILLTTCLAALVVAAPASADSIVYVKDGNVWLTSPDGARAYQVTSDGGYSDPSQADDGTIVALQGKLMVRMDRSGHRLNDPVAGIGTSQIPGGDTFYGPYEPRVSPDGKRIAYWFGQYTQRYDYGCNCYLWRTESASTWTWSDRFATVDENDHYLGIEQPEWLTNDRLLATYPMFWMNLWTYKIGTKTGYASDAAQFWAGLQSDTPDQWGVRPYYDFGDAALSPDGHKLAMTDGGDTNTNTRLSLASVSGPAWVGEPPYENDYVSGNSPVTAPALKCQGEVGAIVNPTWSPDSRELAYSLADGIHVLTVPDSFDCGAIAERTIAPGGSSPDWGPADVDLSQKPAAGGPAPGTSSATPFTLSGIKLAPKAFRAARRGPAIAASATGATLSFTVSDAANVVIKVRGVKGSIRTAAKPGINRLRFMGRVAKRSIKPGRHVLTLSARPLSGAGSARHAKVKFRIMR